jgi:hypothetical protein
LDQNTKEDTPLEQYVRGFASFLSKHATALVRRVIVIDNADSPVGMAKQKRLREDIRHNGFINYINRLHHTENDVRIWLYPRPWPGWLTDAVFYGTKTNGEEDGVDWHWAVTSSYDAQEDLIVLQLHTKLGKRLKGWRPLPAAVDTLRELVELLESGHHPGLMTLQDFSDKYDAESK